MNLNERRMNELNVSVTTYLSYVIKQFLIVCKFTNESLKIFFKQTPILRSNYLFIGIIISVKGIRRMLSGAA